MKSVLGLPPNASRGSALLLVLWAVAILGMVVLGVATLIELGANRNFDEEGNLRARALALSGVALGFEPELRPDDPLLHQTPASGSVLSVRMSDEGGRLNLNELLVSGHPEVLQRLFVLWGVEASSAHKAVQSLEDQANWSNPQNTDPGSARSSTPWPFRTLQQVSGVLGMESVMRQHPNWQDSITLWSDGRLNVNAASDEALAAFFGLSRAQVAEFIQYRNGEDGLPGTSDDRWIEDPQLLVEKLHLAEGIYNQESFLLCFHDDVRRVRSAAQVAGSSHTITAVAELGKKPWQYFLWSEN